MAGRVTPGTTAAADIPAGAGAGAGDIPGAVGRADSVARRKREAAIPRVARLRGPRANSVASTSTRVNTSVVRPSTTTAAQPTAEGLGAEKSPWRGWRSYFKLHPSGRNTERVPDRNVLGGPLEPCGTEPLTGYYRDGCCSTGPQDLGRHTICAVMTAEFLEHQRSIGNDLLTPVPEYRFPGLLPGDRWCVTALNWLRAHHDGCAAPVVLASTHQSTLEVVPLEALQEHQVDVPDDLANL